MYGSSETTQKLMERFRNQRFRADAAASASQLTSSAANERCGDSVELVARLHAGGGSGVSAGGAGSSSDSGQSPPARIVELHHRTVGCSICQVSADFLCEAGRGLTLRELAELGKQVQEWLHDDAGGDGRAGENEPAPVPGLELLAELRGTRARARCVLLGWEAVERLAEQAGQQPE